MPSRVLLDTNIVSAYMHPRQQKTVITRIEAYLQTYGQLDFSIITRYEVLRGLRAKGATTRLEAFSSLCEVNRVLPLTDDIVVQAADIYADLYRRGALIGDADTLIAATALVNGMKIATNNEAHFNRVVGLQIENWLK